MIVRIAVCALLLAAVYASPVKESAEEKPFEKGTEEKQIENKTEENHEPEVTPNQFWNAIKSMLEKAIEKAEELPDPADYPDNYNNSTIEEKTVNGTKEITNTTVEKKTEDGLQKTLVTKTQQVGGKLKEISQMLQTHKLKGANSTETELAVADGSGEEGSAADSSGEESSGEESGSGEDGSGKEGSGAVEDMVAASQEEKMESQLQKGLEELAEQQKEKIAAATSEPPKGEEDMISQV